MPGYKDRRQAGAGRQLTATAIDSGPGVVAAGRKAAGCRIAGDGMSLVDGLAVAYLSLPVALFFFTWFKPLYAIPFGIAALYGLASLVGLRPRPAADRAAIVAFAVALVWATLSGAGHFFYANYFDWQLRDAVMRDLAALPAPATYRVEDGVATILRAPLGFYMLPAMLGRLVGLRDAPFMLYLWTLAGVFLFLMQVMAGERRWAALACIAAVVVLFSGMDAWEVPKVSFWSPTSYKDWWAYPYFNYTSNTTALFWAPNHIIPAWLGIALVYRCRDDPRFHRIAAWVGALTLIWSPLVSVGLLPFFILIAVRAALARRLRPFLSVANLLAAPMVAIPIALYMTAAASTIHAMVIPEADWLYHLRVYVVFVLVEFLILTLALLRAHRDAIEPDFFVLAIVVLLLLPLYRFGPSSDLATRASAGGLMVLMFTVVDGWARPLRLWGRGIVVTFVLLSGALTPLSEFGRAILWPHWQLDLQRSIWTATSGGHSPNYLAELRPGSLLSRLLRDPVTPAIGDLGQLSRARPP